MRSMPLHALGSRSAVAWKITLYAFVLLAGLCVLAAGTQAMKGTGKEIGSEGTADSTSAAVPDTELYRLGASSDANNIHLWLTVGAKTPTFDPSTSAIPEDLKFSVDLTDVHSSTYYADNTWTAGGAWGTGASAPTFNHGAS